MSNPTTPELLGRGTFGRVFADGDRIVKVIRDGDQTGHREVTALRALEAHCTKSPVPAPHARLHTATAFGSGDFDLRLERYECNLRDAMNGDGPEHLRLTSSEDRLNVMVQLARGLATIHAAGVCHFDIKPMNIVLRREEANDGPTIRAAFVDFGSAVLTARLGDLTGRPCTTPWYDAPEIILRSGGYGPACDVWSLGSIFAYIASGGEDLMRRPLDATTAQAMRRITNVRGQMSAKAYQAFKGGERWEGRFRNYGRRSRKSRLPGADIHLAVEGLISLMLDLDPAARPSAAAILEALLVLRPAGNLPSRQVADRAVSPADLPATPDMELVTIAWNAKVPDLSEEKQINARMRTILFDWLRQVSEKHAPGREQDLRRACDLVDATVAGNHDRELNDPCRCCLQLYGIGALVATWLYSGTDTPIDPRCGWPRWISRECGGAFSPKAAQRMLRCYERVVATAL